MPVQYPQTRITPWQHQIDGFDLAKNQNAFYYAWDMGAGKTKGAIDLCNYLNSNLVSVAPSFFVLMEDICKILQISLHRF